MYLYTILTQIVILARKVRAGKEAIQKHDFIQSCPRGSSRIMQSICCSFHERSFHTILTFFIEAMYVDNIATTNYIITLCTY